MNQVGELVKGNELYQGKAKRIYATNNADILWVQYKDDATAFNGLKKGQISNKGYYNNQIASIFFQLLQKAGIDNHFVMMLGEREMAVKALKILPVEVVVRNVVAGSLAKRLGLTEGIQLAKPVVELYYKDDALGDPLINDDHALLVKAATVNQLAEIKRQALAVNEVIAPILKAKDILLVDFKLEFGLFGDQVLLGDEISPDTCRFWDIKTGEKMDKDRFRRDLGQVEEAYAEILKRLQGGVENV
ncbi:MAG: phosphoribosylaminoimidazolesuccinocarboxamide synthase [Bacillota bacterium]|nr:phosphoribosylaminoimidazolesuccinocarboxamide synthase [Bacillota bacterium]